MALFTRAHAAAGQDVASATANAHRLQNLERALHIDVELAANQWLAGRPGLAAAAAVMYRLHSVVLAGVVLWALFRRPERYLRLRRVLLALGGIALLGYWAMPMSPPRFALPGVVDVVAASPFLAGRAAGTNEHSAMPSMHVGWSAWCAYAVWSALRATHARWRWAARLYPLMMTGVVLGTGNHYVLDLVGSAGALGLAVLVGSAWHRWSRPPGDGERVFGATYGSTSSRTSH